VLEREEKEMKKLDDKPDMDFEDVQLIKEIVTVYEFNEKIHRDTLSWSDEHKIKEKMQSCSC